MSRMAIADHVWNPIYMGLRHEKAIHVSHAARIRHFMEAVICVLRTGIAWADLPKELGNLNTIRVRFRRWTQRGVWERLHQDSTTGALLRVCIDATICKAHRSASGPRGRTPEAIGQSRGGRTTKIHAAVDVAGRILALRLTKGQAHESLQLPPLLNNIPAVQVLADRAYDGGPCRDAMRNMGAEAVIPSIKTRLQPIPYDAAAYRDRHAIENVFCRMKDFMRITIRRDKTRASYLGFVCLGAAIINHKIRS